MTHPISPRRIAMGVLTTLGAILLSGCWLMPGQFVSEMTIMKDGHFSYSYQGEIHLLTMSKLAQMERSQSQHEFSPELCFDEDTIEERECTSEEIAEQKATYETRMAEKAERDARETEQIEQMFGGVDPNDPKMAERLAERLEQQAGFRNVTHKGDGAFEVDFLVEGQIDYDFVFPTFEGFPLASYFVMAGRRDDGTVRIDAPGFTGGANNPMQGMMGSIIMAKVKGEGSEDAPQMPELNGTFTITTDGELLANNTDQGAAIDANGLKRIEWTIDRSTATAPMALIKLTP